VLIVVFGSLAVGAALDQAEVAFAIMCGAAVLLGLHAFGECHAAMAVVVRALQQPEAPEPAPSAETVPCEPVAAGHAGFSSVCRPEGRPADYVSANSRVAPVSRPRILGDEEIS
jgi:hypothetical protein